MLQLVVGNGRHVIKLTSTGSVARYWWRKPCNACMRTGYVLFRALDIVINCNSQVTLVGDSLVITPESRLTDTINFCKPYNKNVRFFDISALQNPAASDSTATPESLTNAEETTISSSSTPTSEQTTRATPKLMTNVAHRTMYREVATMTVLSVARLWIVGCSQNVTVESHHLWEVRRQPRMCTIVASMLHSAAISLIRAHAVYSSVHVWLQFRSSWVQIPAGSWDFSLPFTSQSQPLPGSLQ